MCYVNFVSLYLPSFLAFLTILVAFITFINQTEILILNQLSEKSKECNESISQTQFQVIPNNLIQNTNILSAIITAIQLLDYNLNRKWYLKLFISRESCLDQFYLQLHTSIRNYIGIYKTSSLTNLQTHFNNSTINQLFTDASNNLSGPCKKYN